MVAIWDDRLAEVWSAPGRAGAGVVVGADAVLTARHVVAGALDGGRILSRVIKPGAPTADWIPMIVLAEDEDWDVAILGVDYRTSGTHSDSRPQWVKPSSFLSAFVRVGSSVERGCEAVGFPQAEVQHAPAGALAATVRQTEQVVGILLPAGQAKRPANPERPLPKRWIPLDVEQSTPGAQAGWGGMSGAGVVLGDGRLAGLVVAAEAGHQQRRLYVVPIHDVLAESAPIRDALARVLGDPIVIEAKDAPLYRAVLQDGCLAPDGTPLLVREASYKSFGVKAAGVPGEPFVLDYVPRDADQKLQDGLQAAQAKRRILVLVGGSAAGKSRSAAEAVRLYLPDHRLLVPRQTSLARIRELPLPGPEPTLAWLDDAERYEERAFRDSVEWLLRSGAVVVATIRGTELERMMPKGDLRNPLGEALTDPSLVVSMSWPTLWNDEERGRVREHVSYPPLLAWVDAGRSPSAWVVAGPALSDRLRAAEGDDERPARFAVVRAVLDWYRTGIARPVPSAVVPSLLRAYLPSGPTHGELEEALRWAFESVTGAGRLTTQSLLAQTSTAGAITVHDYVQDADAASDRTVPDVVWLAALEEATFHGTTFSVGLAAGVQGNVGIALKALIPLAIEGDSNAMFNLGVLMNGIDLREARRWWEQAAAAGRIDAMYNLGVLLADSDPDQSRRWSEKAAEAGNTAAMYNLGVLLADSDPDQARHWSERAAEEAGTVGAMYHLGWLLTDSDPEQARRWYEQAAAMGHTSAMYSLGAMFEDSDPGLARYWYQQAAQAGHANAMNTLGTLLVDSDPEQARRWWEQSAEAGNADAVHNLEALPRYMDQEQAPGWHQQAPQAGDTGADTDPGQARHQLERAAQAGDTDAMVSLGLLLEDGDLEQACHWWKQAAQAGIVDAMNLLGVLLQETDPEQARHWYEQAAQAGDTDGMVCLGLLLEETDPEQARHWYEQAAQAGDTDGMVRLGSLLEDNDPDQALHWYEQAAQAGDNFAMKYLAVNLEGTNPLRARYWNEQAATAGDKDCMLHMAFLLEDSDPGQSRRWYVKAALAGNTDAMYILGLLLEISDPDQARHWHEQAAAAGDKEAMLRLGFLLKETDPGQARRWYEQAAQVGDALPGLDSP